MSAARQLNNKVLLDVATAVALGGDRWPMSRTGLIAGEPGGQVTIDMGA